MLDFRSSLVPAVIRCMERHRGRKVSLSKVTMSFDRFIGDHDVAPFERLYAGVQHPWQVVVSWPGPEAEGLAALEWFESQAGAIEHVVEAVDRFRLYPTSVVASGSQVRLLKGDHEILRLEPLQVRSAESGARESAKRWLQEALPGGEQQFLQRLGTLPGLEGLTPPVRPRRDAWGRRLAGGELGVDRRTTLFTTGPFLFEPETFSQRLRALYASHNIHVSVDVAQDDAAYLLGFETWGALVTRWQVLRVFSPVEVKDHRTGQSVLCASALDGILEMAKLAQGLGRTRTWAVQTWQFAPGVRAQVYALRDSATELDEEVAAVLSLEDKAARGARATSPPALPIDAAACASYLAEAFGVNLPAADQVARTNWRRKTSCVQVGRLLFGAAKLSRAQNPQLPSHLIVEVLQADGWRHIKGERRWLPGKQWRTHAQQSGIVLAQSGVLRVARPAAWGYWRGSKDFVPEVLLSGARKDELMALVDLLEMTPMEGAVGYFASRHLPDVIGPDLGDYWPGAIDIGAPPFHVRLGERLSAARNLRLVERAPPEGET